MRDLQSTVAFLLELVECVLEQYIFLTLVGIDDADLGLVVGRQDGAREQCVSGRDSTAAEDEVDAIECVLLVRDGE